MALPNTAARMQYSNSSKNLQPFFASRMMHVLIACPLIMILMIFMYEVMHGTEKVRFRNSNIDFPEKDN